MFSQACVKNSVHKGGVCGGGMHGGGGMCGGGCAWQGVCMVGVHGRRACMAGGHAWQGGMHGRGHAWQEKTAIAAGGTHSTRMHSCLNIYNSLSKTMR